MKPLLVAWGLFFVAGGEAAGPANYTCAQAVRAAARDSQGIAVALYRNPTLDPAQTMLAVAASVSAESGFCQIDTRSKLRCFFDLSQSPIFGALRWGVNGITGGLKALLGSSVSPAGHYIESLLFVLSREREETKAVVSRLAEHRSLYLRALNRAIVVGVEFAQKHAELGDVIRSRATNREESLATLLQRRSRLLSDAAQLQEEDPAVKQVRIQESYVEIAELDQKIRIRARAILARGNLKSGEVLPDYWIAHQLSELTRLRTGLEKALTEVQVRLSRIAILERMVPEVSRELPLSLDPAAIDTLYETVADHRRSQFLRAIRSEVAGVLMKKPTPIENYKNAIVLGDAYLKLWGNLVETLRAQIHFQSLLANLAIATSKIVYTYTTSQPVDAAKQQLSRWNAFWQRESQRVQAEAERAGQQSEYTALGSQNALMALEILLEEARKRRGKTEPLPTQPDVDVSDTVLGTYEAKAFSAAERSADEGALETVTAPPLTINDIRDHLATLWAFLGKLDKAKLALPDEFAQHFQSARGTELFAFLSQFENDRQLASTAQIRAVCDAIFRTQLDLYLAPYERSRSRFIGRLLVLGGGAVGVWQGFGPGFPRLTEAGHSFYEYFISLFGY